jgi:2-iminobutanoate/2-iminopropanoate deaminase
VIRIQTDKAPKPVGAYSQAVKAGDFLFISGQIGINPKTGEVIKGDIKKEIHQVLANLQAILEAAGSSPRHIVKMTVYLTDLKWFPQVNQACEEFFGGNYPAREAVQVSSLPKGVNLEISAMAAVHS